MATLDLAITVQNAKQAIAVIEQLTNAVNRLKAPINAVTDAISKHTLAFRKLGNAVKRIAFYRTIRAAMKAVVGSFREGIQHVALYSKAINNIDSARASATMNEFATTLLYVKNSLGAMVMPLLQALVPVANAIADAFVAAANAVNMFFHALKGETTFTKAKKYAVDFADGLGAASGKAKELKKQIFGFDELNIFHEPSSGGGGGGDAMDYSKMFEEATINASSFAEQIRAAIEAGDWGGVGSVVAEKLNSILDNFDAKSLGNKIQKKLRNALNAVQGFLSTFNFGNAGAKVADLINGVFHVGRTDFFTNIGESLAKAFTGVLDLAGSLFANTDFEALGAAIGNVITGIFNHISEWLMNVDWVAAGATFFNKVYDFVTGIDFGKVATSFFLLFGSALSAAWDAAYGIISALFTKVSDYFHKKTDECGGNAVLGFLKGIVDALVGIVSWVYDNVVHPFLYGLTKGLGMGDNPSPKGVMYDIAKLGIDAFFNGLTDAWKAVKKWIDDTVLWVKNAFKGLLEFNASAKLTPSMQNKQNTIGVSAFAEGGQPKAGSLFWAGENGSELLTQIGGRSTVTTQDQFSEGMANIMDNTNTVIMQAAQALIQAIQSKPVPSIRIGDRDIVSMYDRGKTLAGGALVE